MGLDLVEMVVRIEEEFEVRIPDEVAETLLTPRNVVDFLMTQPSIQSISSRETVALKLWFVLEDELGIERYLYTEDSRFIQDMGLD
jgi:hypothetical protein